MAALTRARLADREVADTYAMQGSAFGMVEQFDDALQALETSLELDSKSVYTLTNMAQVRAASGDLERALEDLDRALELDPLQESALLLRAKINQARR